MEEVTTDTISKVNQKTQRLLHGHVERISENSNGISTIRAERRGRLKKSFKEETENDMSVANRRTVEKQRKAEEMFRNRTAA